MTGVITEVTHSEGSHVSVNTRLAIIRAPRATPYEGDTFIALKKRLMQRQAALEAVGKAQEQQLDTQVHGLQLQLSSAQHELSYLQDQIHTRELQLHLANKTLVGFRTLMTTKYISQQDAERQQNSVLEYSGQIQELQRQTWSTQREIGQLQQTLAELPAQQSVLRASTERELAQVAQERIETESQGISAINSAISGIISSPLVKVGQSVKAGEAILIVLPRDGALEANIWVPSRAIGFITLGDMVQLRYQAYPYQKFGYQKGYVATISRAAIDNRELSTFPGYLASSDGETFYRVTVRLAEQTVKAYGKPEKLKPGMALHADILGEKRRLIEWIFDPLYSLTGRHG